jgi:hypothetical protein
LVVEPDDVRRRPVAITRRTCTGNQPTGCALKSTAVPAPPLLVSPASTTFTSPVTPM